MKPIQKPNNIDTSIGIRDHNACVVYLTANYLRTTGFMTKMIPPIAGTFKAKKLSDESQHQILG